MHIFPPQLFTFPQQNSLTFPPHPSQALFPHLDKYSSDKNPNLSECILGHAIKAAARLITYPKL